MTRQAVAVLTAVALAAGAAPAAAHRGHLPPMPPLPEEPAHPDFDYDSRWEEDREEWRGDCGGEYYGDYPDDEDLVECGLYPEPYAMGFPYGGPGPAFHYGPGYPGYGFPVMMVPVKIKTRYVYSEPLRREKEVVVEEWVDDEMAGRKIVGSPRKASKAVPTSDGKTTRSK
ncbi:hypothetical protein GRI75_00805 [Altererythrobacter soli]|uniref:Uncharacterized protein n=1 Tax=Croceibacterium soli TaxID=1739690 RepID=A0A6I4UMF0_9SPHN|nr:hypothetical protein [Croceibacterium soli]MXP40181.1 hypothetical protein [Croceibacterium soli]